MQICGCAYKGLTKEDKFFTAVENLYCDRCGSPQIHLGMVVFGGHLQTEFYTFDILVWTKPIECLYCGFVIRDVLAPCGDYVLDFSNYVLPTAC